MQGWITWFGWVSTLAGVANTSAYMLLALVQANYPDYVYKAWHQTLIIFALLIVGSLMNVYTWFIIPWFEVLAGCLHIILFIIFVAVLLSLAPQHTGQFVFLKQYADSGWSNKFIEFNLGLLTPIWGFVGESRFRSLSLRPLLMMSSRF